MGVRKLTDIYYLGVWNTLAFWIEAMYMSISYLHIFFHERKCVGTKRKYEKENEG